MSDAAIQKAVRDALGAIEVPGGGSLAEFPGLSDIIVTKGAIAFALSVAPGMEKAFAPIRTAAEEATRRVSDGRKVMVSVTANRAPANAAPKGAGPQAPQGNRPAPPPRSQRRPAARS